MTLFSDEITVAGVRLELLRPTSPEALIDEGHEVSVISPADDDTPLPSYVTGAGRAVPVRREADTGPLQWSAPANLEQVQRGSLGLLRREVRRIPVRPVRVGCAGALLVLAVGGGCAAKRRCEVARGSE